jgi:diguanylate cyclase (GGDEF)-like protein
MQHDLIRHATTDSLTGLFNRREFFHRAMEAIGDVRRGATLSAVMFDIDHFKRVNDKYGHEAGDRALTAIASVVKGFDGISGRLGGEEFCLLAPDGQARAMEIAEDLRRAISDARFKTGCRDIGVTCSLGVAEWQPGNTIDALLQRADMALYLAKKAGRNRVVAADQQSNWGGQAERRSVIRVGAERVQ